MYLQPQIINDPRNPERLGPLMEQLSNQGINDAVVWEACITEPTVEASINRSHKDIVRWAQERELEECCIMEDDVQFINGGWKAFLASKPDSFDLYLGGAYGLNRLAEERIAKESPVAELQSFQGLHFYIIHSKYYDKFLSVPDNAHIDVAQAGLGLFYVCQPMIAIQRPGFSATARKHVNYNQ